MKTTRILLLTTVMMGIAAGQLWAQAPTPTDFVRAKADELIAIINHEVTPGTDEFRQRQEDLKTSVRQFIDYGELCRRALGDHWEARTPEEQTNFVELMTRLIETNYTVKLGNRRVDETYQVEYESEVVRDQNAIVGGTVIYQDEETLVEILMTRRDDSWIVFDVVTDDVSMEETYAESFEEIIADEGWEALVQRLEERVTELEQELEAQGQQG